MSIGHIQQCHRHITLLLEIKYCYNPLRKLKPVKPGRSQGQVLLFDVYDSMFISPLSMVKKS